LKTADDEGSQDSRSRVAGSRDSLLPFERGYARRSLYRRRCYGRAVATVVYGDFEWDETKADANAARHDVRFEEAAQALTDPYSVDFMDALHPDRLVTVAMSPQERILYVVTTERGSRIRIISARRASTHERRIYEGEP
jgi:uncharacterized DUF497 family protein